MYPDEKKDETTTETVSNAAESGEEQDGPEGLDASGLPDEDMELSPEDMAAAEDYENDRVAELEAEIAELKDKLLRTLAESENVRRRAERDREDASKYAIANFAREMLSVSDNLRRALDSLGDDARSENETLKSLVVGVEMTEREMLNAFGRIGIKPIAAKGKKFDHNFHEAMFEIEDKEKPSGTVIQEVQTGYMLNDRLLRPAKVGISKGGATARPDDAVKDDEPNPDNTTKELSKAYEKQADQKASPSGSSLDEEL